MPHVIDAQRLLAAFNESHDPHVPGLVFSLLDIYFESGPFEFDAGALSHRLATLSASEMVAALGVRRAPELVRKGLALPFYLASRTLGETLAELDETVAERGLPVDWYSTLSIAVEARALAAFDGARAVYLPDGLPPVPADEGVAHLPLGNLARTLRRLAEAGPRDFYEGEIAGSIARELRAAGGSLAYCSPSQ